MDKKGVFQKNTRLPVANNTALARVAKEICWWFPEFYADRQTSPAREPEPLKRSIDGSATKPCPAYRRHILPRSFLRRPYFQWTAGAERGGFDGGHTLMFRQMGREIPIDAARQGSGRQVQRRSPAGRSAQKQTRTAMPPPLPRCFAMPPAPAPAKLPRATPTPPESLPDLGPAAPRSRNIPAWSAWSGARGWVNGGKGFKRRKVILAGVSHSI